MGQNDVNKQTMKKILLAVLVVLVGYFGYRYIFKSSNQTNLSSDGVVTVERMDLKSIVSATGTLRPIDSVEISSKITARIKTVNVKENEKVTAGQVIATLDGKDYEAKRDQAKFKLSNAESKYKRTKYLYEIGASTKEEYEDALYNYETSHSALEVTESDLAETVIVSPMDGMVIGEPLSPGTMAVQGNSNPTVIMRIADLSRKQILAKIDETDIGNVRVGQSAIFTVNAFQNKKFSAKVVLISRTDVTSSWDTTSTLSSASTSASVIYYYVTLDVDDPENILLPGMTAQVDVTTSNKLNALAIPISALKTNSNGAYVLLCQGKGKDRQIIEQPVQTGIYSDEYVEIVSGLNEGDTLLDTFAAKDSTKQTSNQQKRPPLRL